MKEKDRLSQTLGISAFCLQVQLRLQVCTAEMCHVWSNLQSQQKEQSFSLFHN